MCLMDLVSIDDQGDRVLCMDPPGPLCLCQTLLLQMGRICQGVKKDPAVRGRPGVIVSQSCPLVW